MLTRLFSSPQVKADRGEIEASDATIKQLQEETAKLAEAGHAEKIKDGK